MLRTSRNRLVMLLDCDQAIARMIISADSRSEPVSSVLASYEENISGSTEQAILASHSLAKGSRGIADSQ